MTTTSVSGRGAAASLRARRLRNPSTRANGLWFTEILILFALSIGYLLTVAVPLFGLHLAISSLKHFPMMLLLPALLLHLAGTRLQAGGGRLQGLWAAAWPLALLAVYVTAGSVVARWQLEVDETFLILGFYMLLVPAMALCIRDGRSDAWLKGLAFVAILWSVAALAGALARFSARETLHEIEYIVVSSFVLVFYLTKSRILKLVAVALLLGAVLFNHKLTGYIIAVMALIHFSMQAGWRATPRPWRGMFALGAVVITAITFVALAVGYFEFRQYLPSGNDTVRLKQYEQAWLQFLESPLWGNGFTRGSGEMYRENNRLLNIPTHSDLLDMLKHGGALALALFLVGYVKLIIVFTRAIDVVRGDRHWHAYFTWIRFFLVTALVTFTINPLLLKAPYAFVIWVNAGLALGMALHVLNGARAAAPVSDGEVSPVSGSVSLRRISAARGRRVVARPGGEPA